MDLSKLRLVEYLSGLEKEEEKKFKKRIKRKKSVRY